MAHKLAPEIKDRIAELNASRPYDGRRVMLHENRGGWKWVGLGGVCTRLAADGCQLVMIVETDPEGYWPVGAELLVDIDDETTPRFDEYH